MFARFLHLFLCLPVLVCPAMAGQCYKVLGRGESNVVHLAEMEKVTANLNSCTLCCCCEVVETKGQEAPSLPKQSKQSKQCHDCFCTGVIPTADLSVEFVSFFYAFNSLQHQHRVFTGFTNFKHSEFICHGKPPSGRAILTSYCTLLL